MSKAAYFLRMANFASIRGHHTKALRQLNDGYIESKAVVDALGTVAFDKKLANTYQFAVPGTSRQPVKVERTAKDMQRIIKKAVKRREFEKAIVLLVSNAEDYIFSYCRMILRAYPDRIEISSKGNAGAISVPLKELLERGYSAIIEEQIDARLSATSYGKPAAYGVYFNAIFKASLRQDAMERFAELKASRDLIVHAQSEINLTYLGKVGNLARGTSGQKLPVDQSYFDDAVRTLKKLYSSLYKITLSTYGNDPLVTEVLDMHGM